MHFFFPRVGEGVMPALGYGNGQTPEGSTQEQSEQAGLWEADYVATRG